MVQKKLCEFAIMIMTSVSTTLTFLLVLLSLLDLVQAQQLRYNKGLSKDVTTLLDSLLKEDKYDKRFRPDFGGITKIQ